MATKRKVGLLLSEKDLRKRYPDSGLASTITLPGDKTLRLPSRSLSITHHLGGGIKYGSIIEGMGEESTGKTLLAIDFGVVTQSLGGMVLWDDAEATFDNEWAISQGLNMGQVELLPHENDIELVSDWIADMVVYYRSKLTKNEPILLVIDSIALLESGDAIDTSEVDSRAEMGRRSYLMGKLLRKRMKFFAKYGVCVYLINQLRKKVGASKFEDPETTPLAQVMKFYASQRIGLYKGKRIRDKDETWVGNIVYLRTKKNKSSIPRSNIQTRVYFMEHEGRFGYDRYFGFPEVLEEYGVVKRNRGKWSYKGKMVAPSDEKFLRLIETDKSFRSKMISKININTPSKLRKKLESIEENLYPVKLKTTKIREDHGEEE